MDQHIESTSSENQPQGQPTTRSNGGAPTEDAAAGGGAPIPDPGDDTPSAYTSTPNFAGRQGIRRKTTILLKNPKNYCRSKLSMASRQGLVTLIDIARADAMEKDLHLILPEIANDDGLMHDVEGAFEALAIPFIDRHSIPHLWCVRQCTSDGREMSSYASAVRAAKYAEAHWTRIKWTAGEWEYEEHRSPDSIHAEWPHALRKYDDWLENGFPGRIIRAGDHDILEAARGKR
jgi:hypothetical protein